MLTKADEWPIHQTPEPIAFAGSDRNFYDRYFFCGYRPDGSGYFALAFGVYPALNIVDAHLSILGEDGVQRSLHASRILGQERMDLNVGPIRIEILEPLSKLRVVVEPGHGFAADLVCEGVSFPVQEPRFTRRQGARLLMDATRFTQNVRWTGWIEAEGRKEVYASDASHGTRDRSWGIRPVGAADPQPAAPPALPQFYWLWAPTTFPNLSLYFHVNEDETGRAWNSRAELVMHGAAQGASFGLDQVRARPIWGRGTRWAERMEMEGLDAAGRRHTVVWTPLARFHMKGIGYGHPDWAHGLYKGPLAVEAEAFRPDALDPLVPSHLHVQAVAKAVHEGPDGLRSEGIGLVEQLVIGPHAPSGFQSVLDGAAGETGA